MDKLFEREFKGASLLAAMTYVLICCKLWAHIVSTGIKILFCSGCEQLLVHPAESITNILDAPEKALLEEICWRLPLVLMVKWTGRNAKAVLLFAVALSVGFGSGHSYLSGSELIAITIQGTLGFIWCLLFLKAGGMQGKILKPLLVTTLVHTCYNWIIYVMDIYDVFAS